jgi:tetratricopeptide (TPR) repeat protein
LCLQRAGLNKARQLARSGTHNFFLALDSSDPFSMSTATGSDPKKLKRSQSKLTSVLQKNSTLQDIVVNRNSVMPLRPLASEGQPDKEKEFLGIDPDCWELLRRLRKMADKDIWPTAGTNMDHMSETAYDGIKKMAQAACSYTPNASVASSRPVSRAQSSNDLLANINDDEDDVSEKKVDAPTAATNPAKPTMKKSQSAKNLPAKPASTSTKSQQPFAIDPSQSAVNRGKQQRKEMVFQSLKDKAAKAAKAAVLAMHLAQEANKLHEKLHDVIKVVDDDGELGTRTVGASWLETELSRRHLLEAAVLQRSKLVFPCGLREAKAMSTLPLSQCCPQILNYEDLIKQLNVEDGIILPENDSNYPQKMKQSALTWDESYCRGWRILTSKNHNDNRTNTLYVHEKKNLVQLSEPFDLINRRQRKHLRCELREDFDPYILSRRRSDSEIWKLNHHDILLDQQQGFVLYDRVRDTYSFSLDRDAVSGSRSIVHIYDTQRVLQEAAKFESSLQSRESDKDLKGSATSDSMLAKSIFSSTRSSTDDLSKTARGGNQSNDSKPSAGANRGSIHDHTPSATKEKRDYRQDRVHPKTNSNAWFSIFHPVLVSSTNELVNAVAQSQFMLTQQDVPQTALPATATRTKFKMGGSSGSPEEQEISPPTAIDYSYMMPHMAASSNFSSSIVNSSNFGSNPLPSPSLGDIFAVRPSLGTAISPEKKAPHPAFTFAPVHASHHNDTSSTFLTSTQSMSPEHRKAVTFTDNSADGNVTATTHGNPPARSMGRSVDISLINSTSTMGNRSPSPSSPQAMTGPVISPSSWRKSQHRLSKKSSSKRLVGFSFNDLEDALEQVSRSGRDEMISEEFERSIASLGYERCFTTETYEEYRQLLVTVSNEPVSVGPLLDFAMWFAQRNLGKQTLVCLMRVLEIICTRTATGTDFALLKLVISKLSLRQFKQFANPMSIVEVLSSAPENTVIMAHGGFCLRQLMCERDAERVYTASLLLDPYNVTALRGLAHMYARKQQYSTAIRYLNRINPAEVCYPITRTEIGAIMEMQGADMEAIVVAYKLILSLCRHDKATSMAYHCLGHIHHVRGDELRALDYYTRAIRVCPSNGTALLLSASLGMLTFHPTNTTTIATFNEQINAEENNHSSIVHIDALYRRGLIFYPQSTWIGLISYADFVVSCVGDLHRAELLLWDAVKLTFQTNIWPVIALAHFYQYTMGKPKDALQLLKWCIRRRKMFFNRSTSYPEDDWDTLFRNRRKRYTRDMVTEDDSDEDEFGDAFPEHSVLENVSQDGQNAALCTALAYVYYDLHMYEEAQHTIDCALSCDAHYGPAHRFAGMLMFNSATGDYGGALHKMKQAVQLSQLNPYSLRCYAMMLAMECKYEEAIKYMHLAVEFGGNYPLAWKALGFLTYLYAPNKVDKFNSVLYFTKCCNVSSQAGVQCPETWRLRGQILMEMGKLLPARQCLQTSLSIQSRDPVTIASLALCVAALGGPVGIAIHEQNSANEQQGNMSSMQDNVDALLKPGPAQYVSSKDSVGTEELDNTRKSKKSSKTRPKSADKTKRKTGDNTKELSGAGASMRGLDSTLNTTMHTHTSLASSGMLNTTTSSAATNMGQSSNPRVASLASVSACQDADVLFKAAFAVGLSEIELKNTLVQAKAQKELQSVEGTIDPQLLRKFGTVTNEPSINMPKSARVDISKPPSRHINAVGVHDTFDDIESDVAPIILYWHGMHQLRNKVNTAHSLQQAQQSFLRASNRLDTAPHALAVYMLGWLEEEGKGDLVTAEQIYANSLQLEPFDPLQFLRLHVLVNDTYAFVKQLLLKSQQRLKKLAKKATIARSSQANLVAIFDELAPIGLRMSSFNPMNETQQEYEDIEEDPDTMGPVQIGVTKEQADEQEARETVELMKRRVVMHSRVVSLASIKAQQMHKHLVGIQVPAKYVHIDAFWQERLMHAFAQCDDWSYLLKASKEFSASSRRK